MAFLTAEVQRVKLGKKDTSRRPTACPSHCARTWEHNMLAYLKRSVDTDCDFHESIR